MNTYEEGKKYLNQIGIDITRVTKETGDYIFTVLDDKNIDTDEIKCFAAPQTPPEYILDALGLNIEYFEGKKILDIGGGFNGMPFLLEKYVDQYIVCDPCFLIDVRLNTFDRALTTQEFIIAFNQGILDERVKELEQLELNNLVGSDRYAEVMRLNNFSSSSLEKKKKVLDYINMWKNFNQEKNKNIILNPSKGEDIIGVGDSSQDVVFICHILDKKYVNYNGILAEASRILKPDGEILIVEDKCNSIINILNKLGIEGEKKGNKIVCKIKKSL